MYVCFFKGVPVQTSNFWPSLEKGMIEESEYICREGGEGLMVSIVIFMKE